MSENEYLHQSDLEKTNLNQHTNQSNDIIP
jgi:hypothetical protein